VEREDKEDLEAGGNLILGYVAWFHLIFDKEEWNIIVKAITILRVLQNVEKYVKLSDWRYLKEGSTPWL
jgi:hypothetical protein